MMANQSMVEGRRWAERRTNAELVAYINRHDPEIYSKIIARQLEGMNPYGVHHLVHKNKKLKGAAYVLGYRITRKEDRAEN